MNLPEQDKTLALNGMLEKLTIESRENPGKKEELQIKMGHIIKEMADNHGLKPRMVFGKGNVKAQRARYKIRVIEEKRFQCPECEKVFSSSTSMKHHVAKKVCAKSHCECCNRTFSSRGMLTKHLKSKRHNKQLIEF
jgi:hypothetical protein